MPPLLDTIFYYLQFVPYLMAGVALLAFAVALVRKAPRDPRESAANFGVWALNQFLRVTLVGALSMWYLQPFANFTPLKIPVTWWSAVIVVVLVDLLYYCTHWLEHRVRLLWVFHQVHHSSNEYNFTIGLRLPLPWFGETLYSLAYVPFVLLGFHPALMLFGKYCVLVYQYWVHTETVGKLPWLDKFMNTPSNHRVHHATNAIYLDKNLGGIFIIWDKFFGTYQPEHEEIPAQYGLVEPLNSRNPLFIHLSGPLQLAKEFFGSWGSRWKVKTTF